MSRRSKVTDEERIVAVQEYLKGEGSYQRSHNGLLLYDYLYCSVSLYHNKTAKSMR